jgi:hypothetical protein
MNLTPLLPAVLRRHLELWLVDLLSMCRIWIRRKQCHINLQNEDQLCLHYCLVLALYIKQGNALPKNAGRWAVGRFRVNSSPFRYTGIWPVHPNDLDQVEKLNTDKRLAINVLGVRQNAEEGFHWIRCSSLNHQPDAFIVYLLLIHEAYPYDNSHYVLVKPDKLKAMFNSRGAESNNDFRYMCERCLWGTRSKAALDLHMENKVCTDNRVMKTVLPALGDHYQYFKSYYKKLPSDFIIIADFECFLHRPGAEEARDKRVIHKHGPSQFGILAFSTFTDWSEYTTIRQPMKGYDPDADFSALGASFPNFKNKEQVR